MTSARKAACFVASLLVLAACSKPPAAGEAQTASAAAAGASAGPATTTSEVEMPDMKPGLWEIKINHVGGNGEAHGGTTQQCLDVAAMVRAKQTTAEYVKANCSKNATERAGDTWTNDLVCKSGASVMTTHTTTAMTGDGAYHTELSMTEDPPAAGGPSSTTMDGKWIGACKPT
jgi:hypothetical protein